MSFNKQPVVAYSRGLRRSWEVEFVNVYVCFSSSSSRKLQGKDICPRSLELAEAKAYGIQRSVKPGRRSIWISSRMLISHSASCQMLYIRIRVLTQFH